MSMVLQAAIWMAVHRSEDISLLNLFLEQLYFELPLVTSQRIRKEKKLLLITLYSLQMLMVGMCHQKIGG